MHDIGTHIVYTNFSFSSFSINFVYLINSRPAIVQLGGCFVFCFFFFHCRYLVQNMDWLEQSLGDFDDDYVLFDCPGIQLSDCSTIQLLC